MEVLRTVAQVQQIDRKGKTVGFVPTMGALHDGHMSLVNRCRRENDLVVVSIFVNPTQFNDAQDLERYPRNEDADLALLKTAGIDYVFAPSVAQVYPEPDTRIFGFGALESVMEGSSRPGHFNGVAQVVSRLFEIVKADRAYFGEKDFQQLAIIRRMVEDLGLAVEIVGCPILRSEDGLALSSRNALLTPEQRAAAPHIYNVLCQAAKREGTPQQIEQWATEQIDHNPHLKTEYVTIADTNNLQTPINSENCHIFAAVKCGNVRLIDNIKRCK